MSCSMEFLGRTLEKWPRKWIWERVRFFSWFVLVIKTNPVLLARCFLTAPRQQQQGGLKFLCWLAGFFFFWSQQPQKQMPMYPVFFMDVVVLQCLDSLFWDAVQGCGFSSKGQGVSSFSAAVWWQTLLIMPSQIIRSSFRECVELWSLAEFSNAKSKMARWESEPLCISQFFLLEWASPPFHLPWPNGFLCVQLLLPVPASYGLGLLWAVPSMVRPLLLDAAVYQRQENYAGSSLSQP